ncbi:single-stranded DNA-binding protein [Cronobacter turicensis]
MFSKATLIGVVGIDPRYKPAANGKDSIIAFRIGCKVFTTATEITEWYTIKAFGAVADYLFNNIKKGSNVFLEASIRNRRWVVNGTERQGIEFHAFTARVMPVSDVKTSNQSDVHVAKGNNSQELPFPEAEKTARVAVQPEPLPKPLTAEEARQVADRFRKTFEERKHEADLKLAAPKTSASESKSEIYNLEFVSNSKMPDNIPTSKSIPSEPLPNLTGNSVTDSLLNARNAIKSRQYKTDSFSEEVLTESSSNVHHSLNSVNEPNCFDTGYAQVRGGWSNTH